MPHKLGLSKKERLLKTGQFKHIFNSGNKLRHKGLVIFFLENSLGANRAGFIAPKGSIKLATGRNRTKRFLKEAYRLNKNNLKSGLDIIMLARSPFESYIDAEKTVLHIFNKAGLIK